MPLAAIHFIRSVIAKTGDKPIECRTGKESKVYHRRTNGANPYFIRKALVIIEKKLSGGNADRSFSLSLNHLA